MNTELMNLAGSTSLNLVALLFLLTLLSRNVLVSADRVRAYRISILLACAAMAAETACAFFDTGGSAMRIPNLISNAIGFSCSGLLPYLLAATYDERLLRRRRLLLLPSALLTVVCLLSTKTGWLFSVSADNVYLRGRFFWIYVVVYIGGLGLLLLANCRQSSLLFGGEKAYLLVLYLIFFLGISVQVFWPHLHTSWHCVTLSLLLYYIFQRELQFKYDLLTGALNRAFFDKTAAAPLRDGTVLVIFDLDDFKNINDTYGHQAGDDCLKSIAGILHSCFGGIGRCYRIGGDEFAVLGRGDLRQVEEALHAVLQRITVLRNEGKLLPKVSYGYTAVEKGEAFAAAFRRADQQMYLFKRGQAEHIRHEHLEL